MTILQQQWLENSHNVLLSKSSELFYLEAKL